MNDYFNLMERRQFMKSLAAAASAPLVPAGMLQSAGISNSLYARATTFVSGGAYFSANYFNSTLGLDDAVGKALVSRLKQDGLIGDMGRSGVMFSKTFYARHIGLAAKVASAAGSAKVKSDVLEKVQDVLSSDVRVDCVLNQQEVDDITSKPETATCVDETDEGRSEIWAPDLERNQVQCPAAAKYL